MTTASHWGFFNGRKGNLNVTGFAIKNINNNLINVLYSNETEGTSSVILIHGNFCIGKKVGRNPRTIFYCATFAHTILKPAMQLLFNIT